MNQAHLPCACILTEITLDASLTKRIYIQHFLKIIFIVHGTYEDDRKVYNIVFST